MTSKSQKPVKECEGCALNNGDHCLAFLYPAQKWFKRDCEGYNSKELIAIYALSNDGLGAHKRKKIRKEKAKYTGTIEHQEEHTKFKKITWP